MAAHRLTAEVKGHKVEIEALVRIEGPSITDRVAAEDAQDYLSELLTDWERLNLRDKIDSSAVHDAAVEVMKDADRCGITVKIRRVVKQNP